jgi:hypothetical protein
MTKERWQAIGEGVEAIVREIVRDELAKMPPASATTQPARGALKRKEAAAYLGVSTRTVWRLAALGEIYKTAYGTYPIESLNQHLASKKKKG